MTKKTNEFLKLTPSEVQAKEGRVQINTLDSQHNLKIFFLTSLLSCCLFFCLSTQIQAKTDTLSFKKPKNLMSYEVLKTNPMALLIGPTLISSEIGLSYEFSLSKTKSLSLGGSLLTKNVLIYLSEKLDSNNNTGSNVVQSSQKLKISGYRIQAQYKFVIPLRKYPRALYIGPHVSYSTVNYSNQQRGFTNDYYKIVHNNISMLFGYQHLFGKRVFIDFYSGLGYKYNYVRYYKTKKNFKKVDNEFIFTGAPTKIKLSLGLYLGYKL